jgi:hypothetical protein
MTFLLHPVSIARRRGATALSNRFRRSQLQQCVKTKQAIGASVDFMNDCSRYAAQIMRQEKIVPARNGSE